WPAGSVSDRSKFHIANRFSGRLRSRLAGNSGGDGKLAQTQAAVIGRHQAMTVNVEMVCLQPGAHFGSEQRVHENTAAKDCSVKARFLSQAATHDGNDLYQARLKTPSDPGRLPSGSHIPGDGANEGPAIYLQDHFRAFV